jgi:cyclophilin family peptidyl-prolyl cis-trans isomerase
MKFKSALIPLSVAAMVFFAGCAASQTDTRTTENTPVTPVSAPTPAPQPSSNLSDMDKQLALPTAGDKIAVIETDLGTMKIKLFPDIAPESVKNMEELSKSGKYKDIPFHRIARNPDGGNFVIQTGDFTKKDGTGGYSYKGPGTYIPNEISPALHHIYGALGMARTNMPDTNGSQFYFVTGKGGASFLDGGYTVFGQVYEGMDVMDAIAAVKTDENDRPLKDILVKNVTVMPYTP